MEENPTAGLIDETSDIEIDYDEDGNPIAPPKKKVSTLISEFHCLADHLNHWMKDEQIIFHPVFYYTIFIFIDFIYLNALHKL